MRIGMIGVKAVGVKFVDSALGFLASITTVLITAVVLSVVPDWIISHNQNGSGS